MNDSKEVKIIVWIICQEGPSTAKGWQSPTFCWSLFGGWGGPSTSISSLLLMMRIPSFLFQCLRCPWVFDKSVKDDVIKHYVVTISRKGLKVLWINGIKEIIEETHPNWEERTIIAQHCAPLPVLTLEFCFCIDAPDVISINWGVLHKLQTIVYALRLKLGSS